MSRTYPVGLDARRRPTLPADLLREAGLETESESVAFADQGSIVLSSRRSLVQRAQAAFRDTGRSDQRASVELEVVSWAATVRQVPVVAWAPPVREAGLDVVSFTAHHAEAGEEVREAERAVRDGRSAKEWRRLSTADVALICFAVVESLPLVSSDRVAAETAERVGVSVMDVGIP